MGLLVEGEWQTDGFQKRVSKGHFVRADAWFRNWITGNGDAGPSGEGGFAAESGRYHLYVSHACPWAHRTMIFRELKDLTPHITVSVVDWFMGDQGWTFGQAGNETRDDLFGQTYAHEVYSRAAPTYTGRVTVPILWDTQQDTIVSNESSEIIRMFNSAFNGLTGNTQDYYPADKRAEIDEINERVYHTLNNGVYKCGFATTQEAYEAAFTPLFETLDWLEEKLSRSRYLTGDTLTEADIRLFTTLVRFDPVYVSHFKCNRNRIADMPNLANFTREIYQMPAVRKTVHLDHIKNHYFGSHESINPTRIVPVGPALNYDQPHDRDRFG